jgi:hypothetical protein
MDGQRLDLFPGPIDLVFANAHELVDQLFKEMEGKETHRLKPKDLSGIQAFKAMISQKPEEQMRIVRAAVERAHWQERESHRPGSKAFHTSLTYLAENTPQHFRYLLEALLRSLAKQKLATTDEDVIAMLSLIRRRLSYPNARNCHEAGLPWEIADSILRIFKDHVKRDGMNERVAREAIEVAKFLRDSRTGSQARAAKQRKLAERLEFTAGTS